MAVSTDDQAPARCYLVLGILDGHVLVIQEELVQPKAVKAAHVHGLEQRA